jgi:uncharacterized protein YbaR (Trm112 family)
VGFDRVGKETDVQSLDSSFIEILRCPVSKSRLVRHGDWLYTTEAAEPRRYPIRDGIPVMLIDAAEIVTADEQRAIMQGADRLET